jgi:hypothetical protein
MIITGIVKTKEEVGLTSRGTALFIILMRLEKLLITQQGQTEAIFTLVILMALFISGAGTENDLSLIQD